MVETYDVVVVGAGNGGLAAAATCAKQGLKTLLVEKHFIPGGCATSFVRGRFEMEASLHELCSVGDEKTPSAIYTMFKDLGVDVDWRYEHVPFRAIAKGPDGYDAKLYATGDTVEERRECFAQSVEKAVPGSYEGVKAIFELKNACDEAVEYIYKMKGNPNALVMVTKHADFMRMCSHSVDEVMVALGLPQKARNLLSTYWGYLGVPTDEMRAFHYFNMMADYVSYGAAMPHLKSHELSEGLAQVVYDHGGDILYNTKVTGFLYDENGAVNGVVAGGKEYGARKVISGIMPENVWNMSPAENVPEHARQLSNARDMGLSVLTIYLGLDVPAEELGIEDYTVFVQGTPKSREQYDLRANMGFYIVNCLNIPVPDATPEGTCSLFFTAQLDGPDVPADLTPEGYKKWKDGLAKRYIEDYENVMGISIMPHIEEVSVATPVTFARYLASPGGTIYGYKTSDWDNIMARISAQAEDNVVADLRFVGNAGVRGDGYSCAYITGNDTANAAVRELAAKDAEAKAAAEAEAEAQRKQDEAALAAAVKVAQDHAAHKPESDSDEKAGE